MSLKSLRNWLQKYRTMETSDLSLDAPQAQTGEKPAYVSYTNDRGGTTYVITSNIDYDAENHDWIRQARKRKK